jgi:hypothetical protein
MDLLGGHLIVLHTRIMQTTQGSRAEKTLVGGTLGNSVSPTFCLFLL